jgi:hypothetical protein
MKKLFIFISLFSSLSVFSKNIQLRDLTKEDAEDVTKEFAATFIHTAVAAPETDEGWGLEIGLMAGLSNSPKLSEIVDDSGGKGDKFKQIPNAGLMGRIHIPMNLFFEVSLVPTQKTKELSYKSSSFAVGWNIGRSIGLPFDLAVGYENGQGDIEFNQKQKDTNPAMDVKFNAKTSSYWVGLSKTLWLITPYLKVGASTLDREIEGEASIFIYSTKTNESFNTSGSYMVGGVNLEFGLFKFGAEVSNIQGVNRYAGKFSFDI